jgi:hypothetical protein
MRWPRAALVASCALLLASWWTPVRVTLLVLFGSLVAGYLLKAPCRDASVWADQYQFTHLCYTDTLASFTAYGLDAGQWPHVGSPRRTAAHRRLHGAGVDGQRGAAERRSRRGRRTGTPRW